MHDTDGALGRPQSNTRNAAILTSVSLIYRTCHQSDQELSFVSDALNAEGTHDDGTTTDA
jgi:hypothetical protein